MYAPMEGEEVCGATSFRGIHRVGEFSGSETFETKIVERADFVPTRKKAADARKNYAASRNLRPRFLERKRTAR